MMALDTLEAIRTRRVAKYYDQTMPVSDDMLWKILEAARWAPTGGNMRVHRFVCVTEKDLIMKIQLFFPGMVAALPAALIFVCIDWAKAGYDCLIKSYNEVYYDIGGYTQNMLLAAHAMGLVAGPMTSFSPEAIRVLLNLPDELDPRMCVGVGHPAEPPANMPRWPKKKLKVEDLVQWGPFPVG
ncbi:MAG: nitroreductase family protein [Gammaproteobacteria bacterium]|nr:nitroreductase family protein [Gammaproteobacteria bacterium]